MHVLWFEFMLSLRRLARRRVQNGLMLVTFAVSITLALLSWSLFYTVHLSQPAFDPKGEYYVLTYDNSGNAGNKQATLEEIQAFKGAQVFSDFAEIAFYYSSYIKTPAGAERILGAFTSARALQIAGARPLLGRLFIPADDIYPGQATVLLSEKLWGSNYGRDPGVIGKTIEVNGNPTTIVGVLPADFRFPNDQDLWVSYNALENDWRYALRAALVKLKPGISKERAEGDLAAILSTLPANTPARERGARPVLVSYRDFYLQTDLKVSAMILFALSLLFLAVSCANAANLMIIDFLGRRSEVATTLALGIPRRAAMRSVCWQVGVIALAGALLALAVMPVAGPLLFERVKAIGTPYWLTYHFALRIAGMALLIAGISAAVTVLAPIAYLLLVDPDQVIREHGSAGRGSGRALWRRLLLTGQIALLTVLGVCAGLLVRSNRNVGESHWGFPAGEMFMGALGNYAMNFPDEQPQRDLQRYAVHRRVLEEIERRPTTLAAAMTEETPGYSWAPSVNYALDPAAFSRHAELGVAFGTRVSEGYFDALAVPFVAGRMFPREPPENGPHYAVITAALAQKIWPGENPVQRTFYVRQPRMKPTDPPEKLIVSGVVRDFQASGPLAKSNDGIFVPIYSMLPGRVFLLVRDRNGLPSVQSLTDAVHRAVPGEALYFPSTIKAQIDLQLSSLRMTTDLTTIFSVAAVLLCAIGVYSLTVAQVLQSSREFGIRMALGAEPGRLWRYFARGHLVTALIGVAIGLVAASQVVRVLGALLYGVDPHGAATYLGVALAILLVAALACIPSLFRLKRINPADCLRSL